MESQSLTSVKGVGPTSRVVQRSQLGAHRRQRPDHTIKAGQVARLPEVGLDVVMVAVHGDADDDGSVVLPVAADELLYLVPD
jgi:hypothetical protein